MTARSVSRPRLTPGYLLRYVLSLAVYYTGMLAIWRAWRRLNRRRRSIVLAYHGFEQGLPYIDMFLPPTIFRHQMRYLRSCFDVVPLSEYVDRIETGRAPETDTAVVTMDDGYADNYHVAWSVSRELGMPMTVFVTTGCVDEASPTFVSALILVIAQAVGPSLNLENAGLGEVGVLQRSDKEAAIRQIDLVAKSLSPLEQRELLRAVANAARVDIDSILVQPIMLSWEQIRVMHAGGMEIGAHSVSHAMLSRLSDKEVVDEIAGSIERVCDELGERSCLFAYPYGGPDEVGERVIELCAGTDARAAVMLVDSPQSRDRLYAIGRDMMTLDRSATPWGSFSRAAFACEVHGFMGSIRRLSMRSVS